MPAVDTVGRYVGSLLRRDVDDNSSARWSERAFVKVVISVEAGAC